MEDGGWREERGQCLGKQPYGNSPNDSELILVFGERWDMTCALPFRSHRFEKIQLYVSTHGLAKIITHVSA